MKNIRQGLVVFLILALSFVPVTAGAQAGVTLDEANIALWPEFDRPGMLVIYRIKLSPTVSLPATLAFVIPADAGEPHAVAEAALDGSLYNLAYDREVHGGRAILTLTAANPEIVLEYYDPALRTDGDLRQFTYTWLGDYPVDNLSFQVQEPLAAENFTVEPSLGSGVIGTNGMRYFAGDIGPKGQGETFELHLAYENGDNSLSVQSGPGMYPQPSSDIDQNTTGRINLNEALRWLAGLFVLLLLAGGIFWLLRIRNPVRLAPASASAKRGRRGSGGPEQEIVVEKGPYCHQCGKLAASGDVFCRACGTRLRAEGK